MFVCIIAIKNKENWEGFDLTRCSLLLLKDDCINWDPDTNAESGEDTKSHVCMIRRNQEQGTQGNRKKISKEWQLPKLQVLKAAKCPVRLLKIDSNKLYKLVYFGRVDKASIWLVEGLID
ncbi:hypothetical protein E3N88_42906 [Mikania micrantha]|uniref:Uncharacterized protein n=1 Tax=Mikania micrantha TaxID=192012 RepID=A0A5N6LGF9_9ASTR|nr:hypothetical protein E3N88_42906 [Mikania micrantha]